MAQNLLLNFWISKLNSFCLKCDITLVILIQNACDYIKTKLVLLEVWYNSSNFDSECMWLRLRRDHLLRGYYSSQGQTESQLFFLWLCLYLKGWRCNSLCKICDSWSDPKHYVNDKCNSSDNTPLIIQVDFHNQKPQTSVTNNYWPPARSNAIIYDY